MKGLNTLTLNESTVRAALQLYLDQVVFRESAAPDITNVEPEREGSNYGAFTYKLTVKERELPMPTSITTG